MGTKLVNIKTQLPHLSNKLWTKLNSGSDYCKSKYDKEELCDYYHMELMNAAIKHIIIYMPKIIMINKFIVTSKWLFLGLALTELSMIFVSCPV